LIATGFASLLSINPAFGQESENRVVEQYSCKEVMRESGADRDVAIAFLHGFLLGKSGRSTFQLNVLHKQTLDFIERCLDNPSEKALSVLSKIKD
jgi:hypothetical protein